MSSEDEEVEEVVGEINSKQAKVTERKKPTKNNYKDLVVVDSKLHPGSWGWVIERFRAAYNNGKVVAHPHCKFK